MKLEFDKDALLEIAETTLKRKTGARGLRAIMENIMMDTMLQYRQIRQSRNAALRRKRFLDWKNRSILVMVRIENHS